MISTIRPELAGFSTTKFSNRLEINDPPEDSQVLWCFPDLVVEKLVSYFEFEELKAARLVCKSWRIEAVKRLRFKINLSNNNIDVFLKSREQFDEVFVKDLTKIVDMNESNGFLTLGYPQVAKMRFIRSSNCEAWVMDLLNGIPEAIVEVEFQRSLEHLTCSSINFITTRLNFSELQKLIITMQVDLCGRLEAVQQFLLAINLLKLADFSLDFGCNARHRNSQIVEFCSTLYSFLVRHNSTLKYLDVKFNTNLLLSEYPNPFRGMSYKNEAKLTNLRELNICTKNSEMDDFARALMNGNHNLVKFGFFQHWNPLVADLNLLPQVLQLNGTTLENVIIEFRDFDTIWLKPCVQLVTLQLGYEERTESSEHFDLPNLSLFQAKLFKTASDEDLSTLVLNHMSKLASFELSPLSRFNTTMQNEKIGSILKSKGDTLERVHLELPRIDFCWFKYSIFLKFLELGSPNVFTIAKESAQGSVVGLPSLKCFRIYDHGGSEKLALRLLGLDNSLATTITQSSWKRAPRLLEITKLSEDSIIVTIRIFGIGQNDLPIGTVKFRCDKISPDTHKYKIHDLLYPRIT